MRYIIASIFNMFVLNYWLKSEMKKSVYGLDVSP